MSLKVLHVISTLAPQSGGPVSALVGLVTAQMNLSHEVCVLAPYTRNEDQSISKHLESTGVSLIRVGPVHGALGLHPNLKKATTKAVSQCDVVHIHGIWEDVQHLASQAARKLCKPYVIRPCGMLDPWSLRQSSFRKWAYLMLRLRRDLNLADAIHFTAQTECDLAAPLMLKAPAIVEPNGIDLSEYEHLPSPGSFRNTFPCLDGRPYILFLSRIHPKKGLDLLIPAFADAVPPDYVLVAVGPGENSYINDMSLLAQDCGIKDRFIMPGMLVGRDKLAAYCDADLFCLPSYQENFGNVIIESLACETPVLISNRVNIHQEIVQAEVGRSMEPTVVQLADSLALYISDLADSSISTATGSRAREFAFNGYNWGNIALNWKRHYNRLLASSKLIGGE